MDLKKIVLFGIVCMLSWAAGSEDIPDPCTLLTVQEVENVMHIPMKEGRFRDGRNTFNGLQCTYFSKNRFEKSGSVNITIETTADMKATDHIFESVKEMYEKQKYAYGQALKDKKKGKSIHFVKGLGDEAYWNGISLNILNKDTYLDIRISSGFGLSSNDSRILEKRVEEKTLSASLAIAKQILNRLEKKK